MEKITRNIAPALLIEKDTVSFVFKENEVVDYGYNDNRRKIVIPKDVYEEWIKSEYNDLS